jgi:hypothetical protein
VPAVQDKPDLHLGFQHAFRESKSPQVTNYRTIPPFSIPPRPIEDTEIFSTVLIKYFRVFGMYELKYPVLPYSTQLLPVLFIS